jgi:hypothetical protein
MDFPFNLPPFRLLRMVGGEWRRFVFPWNRSVRGRRLHLGEAEVIRLAAELSADVAPIDDRAAVIQARAQGF